MIICAIIYYFIGIKYQGIEGATTSIELSKAISSEFFMSSYLLLLPILIIVLSVAGVKSTYCMWAGVIGGGIVSIIYQRTSILELLNYIFFGFNLSTNSKVLNETLVSGGVISMVSVVLIVIGAIALSSVLQGSGIINYLTKEMIEKISNRKELILKTGIISSTLTFITCDQTIGIVIPSRLLKSKYKEIGVNNNILARTISDTGTIIAPLMPWNINALIITLVTGISCVEYAPFAILCFIAPMITILFAFNNKI
jgi:NhaC family Na+:H+ antiporter